MDTTDELDVTEAQELLDKGGIIITSGGYTFVSDGEGHYFYTAYGVWPGCLRGGSRPILTQLRTKTKWRRLSLKEVILRNGWCPYFWTSSVIQNVISRELREKHEDVFDYSDLLDYALDAPYTRKQFLDPNTSAEIWRKYFDARTSGGPSYET